MYKKEFDNYLKQSTPKASLLYGESHFFIDFYTKKIIQQIPDAIITTFYFADYELKDVLDILSSGSLFGDRNVVILKLDSKLSKKEVDLMLTGLQPTQNCLIINFYHAQNRSAAQYAQDCRSLAYAFRGEGVVEVRFFAPTFGECIQLLRQKSQDLGMQIQDSLLEFLLYMQNHDIGIALNELEKYQVLQEPITQESIQKLSYGLGSISMEDFFNLLFDARDFLPTYEKMQEEGVEDMDLLRELERYFFTLFLFNSYIKIHGSCDAQEIIGYKPPVAILEKITKRAIRIKHYQEIFEILRHWRNQTLKGEKTIAISSLIKLKAFLG